jgi:hypothetical protein
VAFVSLTNEPHDWAESFVKVFAVPWPCGYEATLPFLAQLGAYSAKQMSATSNPGSEVRPTVYLIGADGRVLWNDGQARPLHTKQSEALVREIDAAIDRALADATSERGGSPHRDVGRKAARMMPSGPLGQGSAALGDSGRHGGEFLLARHPPASVDRDIHVLAVIPHRQDHPADQVPGDGLPSASPSLRLIPLCPDAVGRPGPRLTWEPTTRFSSGARTGFPGEQTCVRPRSSRVLPYLLSGQSRR